MEPQANHLDSDPEMGPMVEPTMDRTADPMMEPMIETTAESTVEPTVELQVQPNGQDDLGARQTPRFRVAYPLSFVAGPKAGEGKIKNLSSGGCRIEGDTILLRDAYVELRVYVPDQGSPMVVDLAAVRWALGWSFGVEFIKMEPEMKERLQQLIESLEQERSN